MVKRIEVVFAGDTTNLDKAFTKVKQSGTGLDSMAKGIIAGAAFGLITDQVGDAVNAASDLQETLSKSNTVFGQASAAINGWAQTSAQGFGLSKQAALEAASSFGNMFSQLGVGSGQAATMSQNIVELAADFASFHNADITEVLVAQQAAFRGEYDALQRFLPAINAAAIEQEALAQTGKKSAASLTMQEKALAANALMFKGAGAAVGDFDRTSGSLANQQRILQANMADLRAELGEALLPAMTSMTSFVTSTMIPAFTDLLNLKPPTGAAGGIGSFINNLAGDVAGFAAGGLQGIMRGGANLAGLLQADAVADDLREAADAGDDFRTKMHATTAELARWKAEAAAVNANQKLVNLTTKDLVGSTTNLGGAAGKTAKELADEAKATSNLKDSQLDLRSSNLSLEQSQHALGVAQDEYNRFLETGGIDAEKVADAQRDLISVQKDVEKATLDVAAAQEAVNEALKPATQREQVDASDDYASAQNDVKLAQFDLTDAQTDYTRILNDSKSTEEDRTRAWVRADEAARALRDAQNRVTDAQTAVNDLMKKGTTDSTLYKDAVKVLDEKQTALKTVTDAQTVAQGALNTAQALGKTHTDDLWKVTDNLKNAQLDLDQKTWGAQKAQVALKDAVILTTGEVRNQWGNVVGLSDELKALPEELTIKINTMFADPQAALAGIQHDTGNILAGSRMASGAGGGNTTIINLNGVVDNAGAARAIQELLLQEQRRSGPAGIR